MKAAESIALIKRGSNTLEKVVDKSAHLANSMKKVAKATEARQQAVEKKEGVDILERRIALNLSLRREGSHQGHD